MKPKRSAPCAASSPRVSKHRRAALRSLWVCGICFAASVPRAAADYASWDWSTGNWTDAGRWSSDPNYPNNGQPDPGGTWTVNVSSGTITRNISPTISTLDFSGGTIQGSGVLTVTGAMTWSGGKIEGGNLLCNGGLTVSGAARLYGSSAEATLASGHTAVISGSGNLSLENQTKITNNGTLYARNDNGISEVGPYQSNFTNTGTFTRDVSSGVFTLGATQVSNSGTYQIQTGTLAITHGITNSGAVQIASGAALRLDGASVFNAGSSFSGSGALILTDNETHIHPALTIPNPVTLGDAAKISVYDGNTLTLNGALAWNGGNLSRESDFFGGQLGYVTLNGGASVADGSEFLGLTITNPVTGIVSLAANGSLQFKGDAGFANAGTFAMGAGSSLTDISGSGNEFTNTGSLVATAAVLNVAEITVPFANSGTATAEAGSLSIKGGGASTGGFQAAAGAKIDWLGDYDFDSGTTFTGAGIFGLAIGHHSLSASLTTSARFLINSSLHVPAGNAFTHHGDLFFSGDLAGGGSLVADSILQLEDGSVTGSVLKNSAGSTATHDAFFENTVLTLHNGAILLNEGDFTVIEASGIAAGTGSGNRFENAGGFVMNAPVYVPGFDIGTYSIGTELVHTGSLAVEVGKLTLSGGGTSTGGTWSVAADALAELSGGFAFTGTNTVSGAGSWIFGTEGGAGAAVSHTLGGTLTLGAPVTLGNATLVLDPAAIVTATAAVDALKGTLTGGGVFHADGGTTIGDLTIDAATLALGAGSDNSHASTTPITLANGGSITNAGTFHARGDFDYSSGVSGIEPGAGASSFSNSGTFVRDTGLSTYVVSVPFHNSGTVSSQSGWLGVVGGGTSTNGTWDTTGGLLTLAGNFTFDGTTTITGTVPPQFDAGLHTVNGPVVSACGLTLIGLADLSVQPMQTVTLDGPLSLHNRVADIPVVSGGGVIHAAAMDVAAGIIDGTTVNLLAPGLTVTQTGIANHAGELSLTLKNGGVFNNAGTYRATGTGSITQDVGAGNIFHNSGTFKRDITTGAFTVSAPFDNSGTVVAETGILSFTGELTSTGSFGSGINGAIEFSGNSSFDSATPFTGAGPIRFTAGTHGFVQSGISTADLTISGGTVTVPAGMTLDSTGATHWTGGTLGGTGTLQTTGGLDLSGAATLIDSVLAVPAVASAVQSATGNLILDGASIVENAGSWHAANALSISPGTAGTHAFHNSGTFLRDTDLGTFVVAVPLHNTGTVGVASGILSLQSDGTSSGEFNVIADTDLSLSGSNTFSGDSSFTGAGRINLQAGTQTIEDTLPSSAIVNLAGSTLAILPTQTFQSGGSFHWTAGPVTGGGTLETSGALDLTTPARTLDGAVLSSTALGTISFDALGTLVLANGATLENLGTTMLLNDGTISAADASAVAFNNSGTVTRDVGTGTFTIAVPFNHSGLLNLNTGSIWFNGGGTASNSTIHTLAGTGLYVGPNYTFGPNNVITGEGATHFSNGSLHVTGSLTTDGSFNWTGGTLDGGGTFTVKGGLSITPTAGVFIDGATLENALGSEAVISGTAGTHILNGGTYRNSGLTRLQGTNNFTDDGGGANSIVNSGTLVRDSGTGNYTITLPIHNTGTIRSTSGALLLNAGGSSSAGALDADGGDIYLNGGSYEFGGGAITGANSIYLSAGTALVTGDTGATSGPATGGFGITGGTLGGTAMLSVDHGYFSAGHVTGSPTLRFTGATSKADYSQLTMSGGTIRNDGTYSQNYQANYDLDNSDSPGGGTIRNNGSWTMTNGNTYSNSYGGGVIENAGDFNQAGGGNIVNTAFNNLDGGALNSTVGYIYLQGGGSQAPGSVLNADGGDIYFNGGTHVLVGGSFTGANSTYASAGTVNVEGDVGAASGPATGGFGISGGTVTGTATLSADHGYLASGHVSGSVTVRFTGASSKADYTQLTMSGGTILNDGAFSQNYQANYDLDNSDSPGGGTIRNNGTWTMNSGSIFYNSYGGGVITNAGGFNQAGGVNSVNASFHNEAGGSINSTSGYILLNGGGTQVPGSILNADGGNIYFNGGTHLLTGGTLTGGTFTYTSAGVVSVDGEVGASSGIATGGFGISGGTVTGTAMLSADHGYFGNGNVSGAVVLRFTGASSKSEYTQLTMAGGTILNEGIHTQAYQANWDLDSSPDAGGGTIENTGTWTLNNGSIFYNSHGGGVIENSGDFNQAGGGNSVAGAFHSLAGSAINATGGYISLQGGGTMAAGAVLNADGGSIYFNGGSHVVTGGTLTGSAFTYASAGTVSIDGNVGATTGSATGGFGVSGGTVTGSGMLSADHGYFGNGQITGSPTLRFTGEASRGGYTALVMDGGTIRNEGSFTQAYQANWDLDNSAGEGGGTIENTGTWTLTNGSTFANSHGGGVIRNSGAFNQAGGGNLISAAFHSLAGGALNATSGYIHLQGGGSMVPGSVLNAAGGDIYFNGGTHLLTGGSFTGANFSFASAGVVSVDGNVGALTGPATGGFGVAGGTVTGSAVLSADHGYFSSGHLAGTVVLRFTGASNKYDYTHLTMSGGTIRNEGAFTQSYQANWDLDNSADGGGGVIDNRGTWTLSNSSSFYNSHGGGVIENHGTFEQTGGENHIFAPVINSGTVRAVAGTLLLRGGSTHTGALVADSHIWLHSGTHTMAGSGASLGGSGALSGNLTMADGAKLSPGNSPGTLTLYGTVSFVAGGAAPAYLAEIAGPSSSDQVLLGDGATLELGSGLTDLQIALSYAPAHGAVFRIIDSTGSGHFTGTFANLPVDGSVTTASFASQTYHFRIAYGAAGKSADLTVLNPFDVWAYTKGLTGNDALFGADPDQDGIVNGIEFVIGGEPNPANPNSNSSALLPEFAVDETHLRITFRRSAASAYLNPAIRFDADLTGPWTLAEDGMGGVAITTTLDGFAPGIDRVETLIPRSHEEAGKLFGRLVVESP